MKLADLRKIAVRQQTRIRFPISHGLECVINQRGVAQVPGINGVPDFNLETELESVSEFVLEPAGAGPKPAANRRSSREELAALAEASPAAAAHEHEEE